MIKLVVLTLGHGLGIPVGQFGLGNHRLHNGSIQNANGANPTVALRDLAILAQPVADVTVAADFGPLLQLTC